MKLFILLSIISIYSIKSDAICTLQMLMDEFAEDILDNKKLDCKRIPLPAPKDRLETDDERKARLLAPWDTDCAFEADYDFLKLLRDNYGLTSGFVDRDGKSMEADSDDEADICEMLRAMIAGNLFDGVKIDNLSPNSIDNLSCPGYESTTQPCAVSGGSAGQNYAWTILLEKGSFSTMNLPKWKLTDESDKKLKLKLGNAMTN